MNLEHSAIVTVRFGCVEYYDLCEHHDTSKETFFGELEPKIMRKYGLILKTGCFVKIMDEDDVSHNDECEGLIIPVGCVLKITYFTEDTEESFTELGKDENLN